MFEANKILIRRYFTEVLKQGHYEVIPEIFSPAYIFSGPAHKKPIAGMPNSIYEFVSEIRSAFPDLFVSIENEIAEDDQVAVVWRMAGTHTAPFRGIAPSGKYISITGTDIFYLENNRIEGMWAFFDMKSLLEQLIAEASKEKIQKRSAVKKSAQKK